MRNLTQSQDYCNTFLPYQRTHISFTKDYGVWGQFMCCKMPYSLYILYLLYVRCTGCLKKLSFTELSICRFATNIISISPLLAAGSPTAQFLKLIFLDTLYILYTLYMLYVQCMFIVFIAVWTFKPCR